jgi:hypothetical protein
MSSEPTPIESPKGGGRQQVVTECGRGTVPIVPPAVEWTQRGPSPHPRRVASSGGLPAVVGALRAHHQQTAVLIEGLDELTRAMADGSLGAVAKQRRDAATVLFQLAERLQASDRRLGELRSRLEQDAAVATT